jgi:hypothetical protein
MGNNRGIRPATPASPDYPAQEIRRSSEAQFGSVPFWLLGRVAAHETTYREDHSLMPEPIEDSEGEEREIEEVFRRKIAGLRRLPRRDRAAALRAAREWRAFALRALREKRAGLRYARHLLRRLRMLVPG